MSCRARVYVLHLSGFKEMALGQARIRNLPADASIEAFSPHADGKRIGLRVCSQQFSPVPAGTPLPMVVACVEVQAGVGA